MDYLANYYKNSNEVTVQFKVISDKSQVYNCLIWASPISPSTGTSLDNGVCAKGSHNIYITYKNLVLVPIGM